jgi:hypothetical protein
MKYVVEELPIKEYVLVDDLDRAKIYAFDDYGGRVWRLVKCVHPLTNNSYSFQCNYHSIYNWVGMATPETHFAEAIENAISNGYELLEFDNEEEFNNWKNDVELGA